MTSAATFNAFIDAAIGDLRNEKQLGRDIPILHDDLGGTSTGKGFQGSPDRVEGMGLRTMRYRATLIGAILTVDSALGQGTTETCQFCKEATHERD